jgi:hypothetical protein
VLKLVKLKMRDRFVAPNVGLNFRWLGTVDYKIMIHMTNTTWRMHQNEDTKQTQPLIRIIRTLSRHGHGVVVP